MDGIHCLQDIFLTLKLVHTSVIVLGQELLRPFNVLTMEKIIFLYLYSILNKLSYSIFQFHVVMLMLFAL